MEFARGSGLFYSEFSLLFRSVESKCTVGEESNFLQILLNAMVVLFGMAVCYIGLPFQCV